MNIIRKIQYNQYWNIGFCEQTPEELICDKRLRPVRWLKHPYRDRWFADPFLYKVTECEIFVFVEECPMENPKGIICELVIDRKTMYLKERYVMLELDTHLSYPAIIRQGEKVYVYPENGASGMLNIYEYDSERHKLVNPICILKEAVADATIVKLDNHFFLSATKFPETEENAYLYESGTSYGPFQQIIDKPYQTDRQCSRQGGNWFKANGCLHRPSQDCSEKYGGALSIMEVSINNMEIKEKELFHINPIKGKYGLGLHTINYTNGLCVIDGCGHFMPFLGGLYFAIRHFIKRYF